MKKAALFTLCLLAIAGCTPDSNSENHSDPTESSMVDEGDHNAAGGTQHKDHVVTDHPADDPGDELHPFFPPSEAKTYTSCDSKKGSYADFRAADPIFELMVAKYDLFHFDISPDLGKQLSLESPEVSVRAINRMSHEDWTIYVYAVGINMEYEAASKGVNYRVLVMKGAEVTGNHFLGGSVEYADKPSETVCRTLEVEGNQLKMVLLTDVGANLPSHIRLPETATMDL